MTIGTVKQTSNRRVLKWLSKPNGAPSLEHATPDLYLLGYTVSGEARLVYLKAVGPHKNFYRALKRD
ncbi:type II toxin-antitoxin system RelE/ParE family toxin [Thauera sp.]|jgi:hypothetical protein|uniref:type II toxin-antitoxin system RelE/ParE family toxin n=1 Tax=Thauera sp. TaxID=1905334 RepID=UPI002A365ABC|nr:type II toxin-antitoxin system RelE/ParE family toxin [Thauera sp.]MDX9885116.1 type II toxin-antitoxin system RelE/ParE family toxin [Thauera sp.]